MQDAAMFSLSDAFRAKLSLAGSPVTSPCSVGSTPVSSPPAPLRRLLLPGAQAEGGPAALGPRPLFLGSAARSASLFGRAAPPAASSAPGVRSPLFLSRRRRPPSKKPRHFTFDCVDAPAEDRRRRRQQRKRGAGGVAARGVPVPVSRLQAGAWAASQGLITVRFDEQADAVVWAVRRPSGERVELRVAAADVVLSSCEPVKGEGGAARVRLSVSSSNPPAFWKRERAQLNPHWPEGLPAPAADDTLVWVPTADFTGEQASSALTYHAELDARYASTVRGIMSRIGTLQR